MRKISRIISIILVVCLLLVLSSSLLACNKNKGGGSANDTTRIDSVNSLENVVMSSIDEKWTMTLANSDIAALDTAGQFVVTRGWVNLIGDVVYNSSMQTAKIATIATYFESEDGKKLIKNFTENGELLFELLDKVNLTSDDISSLIYDFVYSTIGNSDSLINGILKDLSDVRNDNNVTTKAVANINNSITNMNLARTSFVPSETEKANMLAALVNAKSAISDLVTFAYSVSIDTFTDEIIDLLFSESGALNEITNEEIKTVINAIASNITNLKNNLTKEKRSNLNKALNLIIEKFDNSTNTSLVFSQIVKYSKYGYMVVDSIPIICDIVGAVATAFDDNLIDNVKTYIVNFDNYSQDIKIANLGILLGDVVYSVGNTLGESKLKEMVDDMYAQYNNDYQKAVPLFVADVVMNLTPLANYFIIHEEIKILHDEILTEDDFVEIANCAFALNNQITKFKDAYYRYNNGSIDFNEVLDVYHKFSTTILPSKPIDYNIDVNKPIWYADLVSQAEKYLQEKSAKNLDIAKADLYQFIIEYYEEESTIRNATKQVSECALLSKDATAEEISALNTILASSNLNLYTAVIYAVLFEN